MDGGARVRLSGRVFDGRQIRNMDIAGEPIVIDGVPPFPGVFDGQFIQMDVVSIVER